LQLEVPSRGLQPAAGTLISRSSPRPRYWMAGKLFLNELLELETGKNCPDGDVEPGGSTRSGYVLPLPVRSLGAAGIVAVRIAVAKCVLDGEVRRPTHPGRLHPHEREDVAVHAGPGLACGIAPIPAPFLVAPVAAEPAAGRSCFAAT